jgi:6-phosphogluconate dehydrogenase
MNCYFKTEGGHTHVRVFMNGAKCGDLCFRNEEFKFLREVLENSEPRIGKVVTLIDETPTPCPTTP